jgi:hypothetical protein
MDWIKVKDKKPKHDKPVLIYPPVQKKILARYKDGAFCVNLGIMGNRRYDYKTDAPTHWCEYAPPGDK